MEQTESPKITSLSGWNPSTEPQVTSREETTSHRPSAEAEVPHFEAAPSANMNTDDWLLQLMHPRLREVSQELQTLLLGAVGDRQSAS